MVTTPLVGAQGVIAALPDCSQIIGKAFESKQGDPPQFAPTGEGYAIFQVTGIAPAHAPDLCRLEEPRCSTTTATSNSPPCSARRPQELADKAKDLNDLAKAAKEVGATLKTSDLVGETGQVPDFGQVGQVAPQLFDLKVGDISGPINAGRTGVVAKIVDKQEPSADEIAKNFDQTKDQILDQRQDEAFNLFLSTIEDDYKKHKRIQINAKSQGPVTPGM